MKITACRLHLLLDREDAKLCRKLFQAELAAMREYHFPEDGGDRRLERMIEHLNTYLAAADEKSTKH